MEESSKALLGEVVNTTSGGTPSRKHKEYYEFGNICWVKSKELLSSYIINTEEKINDIGLTNSAAKLLPAHSVLIAMYGATVGAFGIIAKPMACNQAICCLLENNNYPYTYLYQLVKNAKNELINMAVGSAQQNISQILIKKLSIHTCLEKIKNFHSFAEPIHQNIVKNQYENESLIELRDILLPKLMSGELDVSNVEI